MVSNVNIPTDTLKITSIFILLKNLIKKNTINNQLVTKYFIFYNKKVVKTFADYNKNVVYLHRQNDSKKQQ